MSSLLLSACLDIFVILIEEAPENSFLQDNSQIIKDILGPCFRRAGHRDGGDIRRKLKAFLMPLFSRGKRPALDREVVCHVMVLLERFIIEETNPSEISPPANLFEGRTQQNTRQDEQRTRGRTSVSDNDGAGGSCSAYFSIEVIEEVCSSNPGFVAAFSSSLVSLADKLTKKHIQDASLIFYEASGILTLKERNSFLWKIGLSTSTDCLT